MGGPCRQLAPVWDISLLLSGKCARNLCNVVANFLCCYANEKLAYRSRSSYPNQSMGSVFANPTHHIRRPNHSTKRTGDAGRITGQVVWLGCLKNKRMFVPRPLISNRWSDLSVRAFQWVEVWTIDFVQCAVMRCQRRSATCETIVGPNGNAQAVEPYKDSVKNGAIFYFLFL